MSIAAAPNRETKRDRFFAALERRHEQHAIVARAVTELRMRGSDPIAIAQLLRAVAYELESES